MLTAEGFGYTTKYRPSLNDCVVGLQRLKTNSNWNEWTAFKTYKISIQNRIYEYIIYNGHKNKAPSRIAQSAIAIDPIESV